MDKKEKLQRCIKRNEEVFAELKKAVEKSTALWQRFIYGIAVVIFILYSESKMFIPEGTWGIAGELRIMAASIAYIIGFGAFAYEIAAWVECDNPDILNTARAKAEALPLPVSLPIMCIYAVAAVRHHMVTECIAAVLAVCGSVWEEERRLRKVRVAYEEAADICRDMCRILQSDMNKIRRAVRILGPDTKIYSKGDRIIAVSGKGDIRTVNADTVFEKDIYCEDAADGMSQILTDKDIAELYTEITHMEEIYSKKEIEAMAAPAIRRTHVPTVRRSDTKAA